MKNRRAMNILLEDVNSSKSPKNQFNQQVNHKWQMISLDGLEITWTKCQRKLKKRKKKILDQSHFKNRNNSVTEKRAHDGDPSGSFSHQRHHLWRHLRFISTLLKLISGDLNQQDILTLTQSLIPPRNQRKLPRPKPLLLLLQQQVRLLPRPQVPQPPPRPLQLPPKRPNPKQLNLLSLRTSNGQFQSNSDSVQRMNYQLKMNGLVTNKILFMGPLVFLNVPDLKKHSERNVFVERTVNVSGIHVVFQNVLKILMLMNLHNMVLDRIQNHWCWTTYSHK